MSSHKKITIEDIEKLMKILEKVKPRKYYPLFFTMEQIVLIEKEEGEQVFDMVNMKIRGLDFIIIEPID